MTDNEDVTTVKASELFFKTMGTLLVLLIAIALTQVLVPHGEQHWGIYRPIAIATLVCAAAGIVSLIWEN